MFYEILHFSIPTFCFLNIFGFFDAFYLRILFRIPLLKYFRNHASLNLADLAYHYRTHYHAYSVLRVTQKIYLAEGITISEF